MKTMREMAQEREWLLERLTDLVEKLNIQTVLDHLANGARARAEELGGYPGGREWVELTDRLEEAHNYAVNEGIYFFTE
jgi:hypothetical protein